MAEPAGQVAPDNAIRFRTGRVAARKETWTSLTLLLHCFLHTFRNTFPSAGAAANPLAPCGVLLFWLRPLLALLGVSLLAACAGAHHDMATNARQEAARFAAEAKRSYPVPGPPEDPWGPYIVEASRRFDVPETWIRAVMKVESGGHEYLNGEPITSPKGAMGLMQLMPDTYELVRARYDLGDDPYDPHNNILAGAAYMRMMYDLYGTPAFLAAYNAGPRRLDDYLSRRTTLPDETRRYVAIIAPQIAGIYPQNRSGADQYAYNRYPDLFLSNPARVQYAAYASASPPVSHSLIATGTPEAGLPVPPAPPPAPMMPRTESALAAASRPSPSYASASGGSAGSGFRLIPEAVAEPLPASVRREAEGPHDWAIQVGAYASADQAREAAVAAHHTLRVAAARPYVGEVHTARLRLFRARIVGLSRTQAIEACARLQERGMSCMVLSPDAQS
jgi:hypothetical protein